MTALKINSKILLFESPENELEEICKNLIKLDPEYSDLFGLHFILRRRECQSLILVYQSDVNSRGPWTKTPKGHIFEVFQFPNLPTKDGWSSIQTYSELNNPIRKNFDPQAIINESLSNQNIGLPLIIPESSVEYIPFRTGFESEDFVLKLTHEITHEILINHK